MTRIQFLLVLFLIVPSLARSEDRPKQKPRLVCVLTPVDVQASVVARFESCGVTGHEEPFTARLDGSVKGNFNILVDGEKEIPTENGKFVIEYPLQDGKSAFSVTVASPEGEVSEYSITLIAKLNKKNLPPEAEKGEFILSDISRSMIQVEGASYIAFSNIDPEKYALASTATIRSRHWLNARHGLEGALKTKIFNLNDQGKNMTPFLMEGRYHYRWLPAPIFGWSFIRANQLSVFGGVEVYKNSGSVDVFIEGWTLAKFGLATRFGIFDEFDTGGEASLSQALSGSGTMIEIQGDLNYAWRPQLHLGLGYRAHLFSGTKSREGFGELYGAFRYSY